jgi:hypothetical protein
MIVQRSRRTFTIAVPEASTLRAYSPRTSLALVAVTLVLAAGCGGRRGSVLDGGLCRHVGGRCVRVTPAAAVRDVRAARREWLREVHADAVRDPTRRFPNPRRAAFERRLAAAARSYRFAVASVTWRGAGAQDVPDVVVESSRYEQLARDLPHVLDAIDPPPRSDSRVYEAIFLEAVDPRHVPFVAVFDSLRDHVMGGQWARADPLYPYAHG